MIAAIRLRRRVRRIARDIARHRETALAAAEHRRALYDDRPVAA